uniref:Carbonyl reductase [NADPH] 1 n=1 Tax=Photinus pyralis TaxID=7054 RepID=A0A1Y1MKD0_PHOPY
MASSKDEKFNGRVYLTCRDEKRGNDSVNQLRQMGFNPLFHQLDINDEKSVQRFRDHIKTVEGGIYVLVNNAGIAFMSNSPDLKGIEAEATIVTNFFGTLRICEDLFPLLRENAEVVNMSSALGHLSWIPSPNLRSKLSDPTLTVAELSELMNHFIRAAKNNEHVEQGWGESSYIASKVGICALTNIQQREFEKQNRNICVNSVHPGYVDTDMTQHVGPLKIEQGVIAPLHLALGAHKLKGQFLWFDSSVVDWCSSQRPKEEYPNFSFSQCISYVL